MGTGIMNSEGDYDPATKTFTFMSKYTMAPGMDTPIREVVKLTDKDHMRIGDTTTKQQQLSGFRR